MWAQAILLLSISAVFQRAQAILLLSISAVFLVALILIVLEERRVAREQRRRRERGMDMYWKGR